MDVSAQGLSSISLRDETARHRGDLSVLSILAAYRDQSLGARDPGPFEHLWVGRVSPQYGRPVSSLAGPRFDCNDLVAEFGEVASQALPFVPEPTDDDVVPTTTGAVPGGGTKLGHKPSQQPRGREGCYERCDQASDIERPRYRRLNGA